MKYPGKSKLFSLFLINIILLVIVGIFVIADQKQRSAAVMDKGADQWLATPALLTPSETISPTIPSENKPIEDGTGSVQPAAPAELPVVIPTATPGSNGAGKTSDETGLTEDLPTPVKPALAEASPTPAKPSLAEVSPAAAKPESGDGIEVSVNPGLPYYREENTDRYDLYQKKNSDLPFEKVVVYVNIGLDRAFYEGIRPAKNTESLDVLVNKYNKLPDSFKPELVKLQDSLCVPGQGEQHLRQEAEKALLKMHSDAKQEGLNIRAYGTYRSISIQSTIWNKAINSGRTMEDVDSLNARGGHSEHHTGLAVDVIRNNYDVLKTPEYTWYKDKAHEYGFIIRYPEGKEHITGYKYEPWHLRYVGPEIATAIYKNGLTYEEYYVTVIAPQTDTTAAAELD